VHSSQVFSFNSGLYTDIEKYLLPCGRGELANVIWGINMKKGKEKKGGKRDREKRGKM
jgi:hypothetical protein